MARDDPVHRQWVNVEQETGIEPVHLGESERSFYSLWVTVRPNQRAYNLEYYRRNRDVEIARVRLRQDGTTHLLRELRRVPCADCGGQFEP